MLARMWRRHRRMAIAVGMVPLVLVLAVVGAGWNTSFDSPERSSSAPGPTAPLSAPENTLWPFMVLAVIALVALLVLIVRDRAWTGFLVVGLLALALVGLGFLGGQLDRGDEPTETESSFEPGDALDPESARNPRLVVIWALLGASVIAAMLVVVRRKDDPVEENNLSEAVAEIAATLDTASQSPRQNIITMYASLETRLAGSLHARGLSETTAEFSARVLHQLGAGADACSELAEIYQIVGYGERDALPRDQLRAGELLRSISADLAPSESQPAATDA